MNLIHLVAKREEENARDLNQVRQQRIYPMNHRDREVMTYQKMCRMYNNPASMIHQIPNYAAYNTIHYMPRSTFINMARKMYKYSFIFLMEAYLLTLTSRSTFKKYSYVFYQLKLSTFKRNENKLGDYKYGNFTRT